MNEADAGRTPHDRFDVPSIENAAGRCPCGAEADGHDARTGEPTCEDCARLWADGGAIDNEFSDAEADAAEQLAASVEDLHTEPIRGGIAIDLVTRQPLFVRRVVADTVVEYFEREGFNLLEYKSHPYLPVRADDTVYECVFVPRSAEKAHNIGGTYDYPRGRLMHVPVEGAWGDADA